MSASSEAGKVVKCVARTKTTEVARRLEELLLEEYWGTRGYAAEALGRLEMDETAEALLAALNGDPHVRNGLESAGTSFAWSVLKTFDDQRKSAGPTVARMTEADMLKIMQAFAAAYLADDHRTRDRLEDTVKDIGEELHRRGGEAKMREILQHFDGSASRHIERVWSGIGGWLG
jgi:HEAT repeat protein